MHTEIKFPKLEFLKIKLWSFFGFHSYLFDKMYFANVDVETLAKYILTVEEQTGDLKITYIGNKDDNRVQSFFIQSYGLISIPLKSNVPNVMIQNLNLAF